MQGNKNMANTSFGSQFQLSQSIPAPNSEMSMNESSMDHEDEEDYVPPATSRLTPPLVQRLSLAEFNREASVYTNQQLDALLNSDAYLDKHLRCQACWSRWRQGEHNELCMECGGFALKRPCALCRGVCAAVWTRNVDMSHTNHEAYWDGECLLPQEEQEKYVLQYLVDPSEEVVLDSLADCDIQS